MFLCRPSHTAAVTKEDFKKLKKGFTAAVATGHGENIIENNVCQVECNNTMDTKELLQ